MVTQKGIEMKIKNILLCLFPFILFASCSMDHKWESIEIIKSLTNIDVHDYVSFEKEYNQWFDFNGDGTRIIIYNIKKESFDKIKNKFIENKFTFFDGNSSEFKNDSLLIGRYGIYKCYEISNGEDCIIYLDERHFQLIWYYSIQ